MLQFPCVNCGTAIIAQHLRVGEEAECKQCGTRSPVPQDAVEVDAPVSEPEPTELPHETERDEQDVETHGYRPFFHGRGGTLFRIMLVNLLLSLVTVGIYSFWATVRVRKFLLGETEFAGGRFTYFGTGRELFVGALKVALLVGLPLILLLVVFLLVLGDEMGKAIWAVVFYVVAFALAPLAAYSVRRYRLSRTSWRGTSLSFRGGLRDCYAVFIPGALLTIITLGLYYPFWWAKMRRYWLSHTHLGDTPFAYDGEGRDLFRSYLVTWLLTVPTLSLIWFWYLGKLMRYDADHTQFAGGRFASSVTGVGILGVSVATALGTVMTLGIASPWLQIMIIHYFYSRLALAEDADMDAVVQDEAAAAVDASGEALGGFLDIDLDFGTVGYSLLPWD